MSDEAPSGNPAPDTTDAPLWRSALTASVSGGELSAKYRLGLILVAAAMVLLPLAYVGFIALAGGSLWWHATTNYEAYEGNTFRFALFYAAPLFFGGIGFVFMFKPLLARRPEEDATVTLKRDEQPLLFDFVERLCACVHAPVPKQIDVHVDPTSTAVSFRRGFLSIFGDDLVLTIGLPLAEALTLREFAGMLAHELGHCRQGAAMRAWYVIARINSWLASAVFLPDVWDHRLAFVAQHSRSALVRAVLRLAQVFIFITRLVLLLLMVIGALISGFLLRQMELDADRYEVGVAGSHTLRETFVTGHRLVFAWYVVHEGLQAAWLDLRLADDLTSLVAVQAAEFSESPTVVDQINDAVFQAKTGVFDTHPAPADRLAHAEREPSPGLPLPDAQAVELFREFRELCRQATRTYYAQVLGSEFEKVQLIDTAVVVRERTEQSEADRTLYRYFQGQLLGHVELFLPEGWFSAPADVEQTIRALRQARQAMHVALPKLSAALEAFEQAEIVRCQAFTAQLLHAANIRFNPADLGLESSDVVAIGAAQERGWNAREQALSDLQTFVRHAESRLTTALCLLHSQNIADKLDDAEALPRVAQLNSVLGVLRTAWPHVQPLREHLFGLGLLMQQADANQRNQAFWTEVQRVAGVVVDLLGKLREAVAGTPYPFEHAAGAIAVADYALEKIPAVENVAEVFMAGDELHTKFMALYFRAMAQLAVTAERVEAAVGLPRLPDPRQPENTANAGRPLNS
jgi:hypothetical protein